MLNEKVVSFLGSHLSVRKVDSGTRVSLEAFLIIPSWKLISREKLSNNVNDDCGFTWFTKFKESSDSENAIAASNWSRNLSRATRHIEIRHLYVRSLIVSGSLDIRYVNTTANPADLLTKPFAQADHSRLLSLLPGYF